MANKQSNGSTSSWTGTQAYVLAVICLVVGVAIGYLVRGSASPSINAAQAATASNMSGGMPGMGAMQQPPTPEQMKHMADVQAQPLLEQLKSSPTDAALLYKIGNVYYDAQIFPEAIRYYEQAVRHNPKQLDAATDLATAYYYAGDADRSLAGFDNVLKIDAKYANALFNQGMIRWQAKMDVNGAVESWKRLLESNPDYPNREQVQSLIAKAEQHANMKPGTKTNKPAQIN